MTKQEDSYLFSATVNKQLPMVVDGKGNYITIEDPVTKKRSKVFDAVGGAAVCALGHQDKDIIKAIGEAATLCSYSFPVSFTNYYAEELAKFYIEKSPQGAFAGALWTGSGSESNENALKIVRQYFLEKGQKERTIFISRKQSYHGYTTGSLALSDSSKKIPFNDILMSAEQFPKVSQYYPYRNLEDGESLEQYKNRLLDEVEATFKSVGPEKVAAFVCETLPGSTFGTQPVPDGYLSGLRKICDKYGALLWLDEVMCGTGRCAATGGLNCWESYPDFHGPDIQTVGKTLGSGFVTIAGILVSPKVKSVFVQGSAFIVGGQTYHQHALNCKVALEVQKKIDNLGLRTNIFEKGELLGKILQETGLKSSKFKIIGDVRGLGGFWSIEFVKNKETKEPFPADLRVGYRVSSKCLENNLIVMGLGGTIDGYKGDHITIAPPFIITEEDVNFIAYTILKSISDVERELTVDGAL